MSTALVPFVADELEVIQRTAKLLAVSGYFDAKGETPMAIAQVATKILAGRELGFGPFAAVNGIHIIQGKPAVGANLMASAVRGSGRYDYRVRKMEDSEVSIEFFAVANGGRESLGTSKFTADDARRATTKNMDKFPRNMLFARAMSNGVRWYCPDVFSGNAVYVPEELGATVDDDGSVIIDAEPQPKPAPPPAQPAPAPTPAPTPTPTEPEPNLSDGQPDGTAASTLEALRGKFHAKMTSTFGGLDVDAARHWYIQGWTQSNTKSVRTSTNDLTADELTSILDGLTAKVVPVVRGNYVKWQQQRDTSAADADADRTRTMQAAAQA